MKQLKFIFISSCCEYWGGSEELWAESATYLKQQGFSVSVFKKRMIKDVRVNQLKADGIEVKNIEYLFNFIGKFNVLLTAKLPILNLSKWFNKYILKDLRPSLVIISQGENFDGVEIIKLCLLLDWPYVILSHKASNGVWPHGRKRELMKDVYSKVKFCFFVSQHNLLLTEAQLGYHLPNAEIVRNPHRATNSEPLPYPKIENDCFKLACVGRWWVLDKGQDILLKVLAQEKWQHRNLQVSFFGQGVDGDALKDLAKLLGLTNVSFPGFVNNIVDIWQEHHAIIMPSRAEGLPIALVEAMMCGRPAIATDVGGIAEILIDNVTGFLATSACFQEIDLVLERAWQNRYEWQQMGEKASASIRQLIPPHPEKIFGDRLVKLCQKAALPLG